MYSDESSSIIDLVQKYLKVAGFDFHRKSADTIFFDVAGNFNTYRFVMAQKPAFIEALIQCQLTFAVPATYGEKNQILIMSRATALLHELFDLIHGALPRGTFHTLPTTERQVVINWAYRLRFSDEVDEVMLENTLNEAMAEVDEFYPALALVLTGSVSAQEAFDTAIPDAYGTA